MAISNTQYDAIMRDYNKRQLKNRSIHEKRMKELYIRDPRLQEIEKEAASAAVNCARARLFGTEGAVPDLEQKINALREEKNARIRALGCPPGYTDPIYDCPDCKDTGYIGREKCHCLKQAIIDAVYSQSNLRSVLAKENFRTFSFSCFSDRDEDAITHCSSRENMKRIVTECRAFIEHFDQAPGNFLFYGNPGTGKTFLSNCIAAELLNRGKSVVYFSAYGLFDLLGKEVFHKEAEAVDAHENIFSCDLLIIDDLGTEVPNQFTASQLFLCVNERILRGKSTIISTNLGLRQLMDTYSERTFSRISRNYRIFRLTGDDIRLKMCK